MSRYPEDPFMQDLEDEFKRFQDQQSAPAPRRQAERKAPAPVKRVSYSAGGGSSFNRRKLIIFLVGFIFLFAWAVGMTLWDKQYQSKQGTEANAVQMSSFDGLFMDMDNNGQIDTLLIDINGDGLIDMRMTGDMVQVNQAAEQPENPPPPTQ